MARIIGTANDEQLDGTPEDDEIFGLAGNDLILGDGPNGGVGSDTIDGGPGDDIIDGGVAFDPDTGELSGQDVVTYAGSPFGVSVNLVADESGFGTAFDGFGTLDSLDNIDDIIGSPFDDVLIGDATPNVIDGGAGNDAIAGGGGDDTLLGGDDDDFLVGGEGDDEMDGGAGDDVIGGFGGEGGDDISGGPGFDAVSYAIGVDGVAVDLAAGTALKSIEGAIFNDTLDQIEGVIGSPDDDTLTGDDQANVFEGLAGVDVIDGGDGRDRVEYRASEAGIVVDLQTGQAEDGFPDPDGITSTDTLTNIEDVVGSEFDDDIAGDDQANEITGLGGDDELQGRSGNDTLVPGAGIDFVDGGDDFDEVSYAGLDGPVEVDLAAGTAIELADSDVTDTLQGIEAAVGSDFGDMLTGNADNNAFEGLEGDDEIDGGGGLDRVDYRESPEGVTVDLASGAADDGFGHEDTLIAIEQVGGSDFDDVLSGDASPNAFQGFAGDDQIEGGDGQDRVEYFNSPAGVKVRLVDGTVLDGFGTEDTLVGIEDILGSEFDDRLVGDGGDNVIEGLAGDDRINGKGGIDTVDYFFSPGRVDVDLDAGTATETWGADDFVQRDDLDEPTTFTDTLSNIEDVRGSGFDDRIRGDDASNFLDGLEGDDRLVGRGGNDILFGGDGDDVLRGGAGNDVFRYTDADEGFDLIRWSAEDVIDIREVVSGTDDPEDSVRLIEDGGDTILQVNPDGDGFVDLARIEGATGLNLDTLIDNGNLVVNDAIA